MKKNRCRVCGKKIKIMIFKGTGLCSVNCQKAHEQKEAQ